MRDGIYHMRYQTATLSATAAIVLNGGLVSGCDRFHFMFGDYHQHGNTLNGSVTFKRHTEHPDHGTPEQFKLVFDGVCSDDFGQFDVRCPAIPLIRGSATFTWLGSLNR